MDRKHTDQSYYDMGGDNLRFANLLDGNIFDIRDSIRNVRYRCGLVTTFNHQALGEFLLLHGFG